MSIVSTVANYGGRAQDNQQGIKQFFVSAQGIPWIYKRLQNRLIVITPSDNKSPVLINNDLIVTGSIYNSSDERLKENMDKINDKDIEDLFTLNPIHFNFKCDNKKLHYGFLAQDVEKLYPHLVENNIDGYKIVNYQEFIPLILAKLKNMQNEINELKNKNEKIN
jgi:hypothetical protein